MDKAQRRIFFIAVIWHLATLAIAAGSFFVFDFCDACYFLHDAPSVLPLSWIAVFATWDSRSFLLLAQQWYDVEPFRLAFFPLYPWLMRLQMVTFHPVVNGLIISHLASVASVMVLFDMVRRRFSSQAAWRASLLFLAFPMSFYFRLVYADALFVFLALLSVWSVQRKFLWPLMVSVFLLPLTRPQGFLMIVPLIVGVWECWHGRKRKIFVMAIVICAFAFGVASYFFLMWRAVGNPWAGLFAQQYFSSFFGFQNLTPWEWLWRNFFSAELTWRHLPGVSVMDRIFFVGFFALLPWMWRLSKMEFVYAVVVGLLPALMGNLMSFPRYMAAMFPLYIVLALRAGKYTTSLIAVFAGLQAVFLIMHSLHYWVA